MREPDTATLSSCLQVSKLAQHHSVFCNYNPSSHNADLVLISCPSSIYPGNSGSAPDYSPALGLIYVASSAATPSCFGIGDAFRVKYIDGETGLSMKQIVSEILSARPRIIGFSSVHQTSTILRSLVSAVETAGDHALIVVGGTNAILKPIQILAECSHVVCCTGEGEKVVRRLLAGDAVEHVDGIAFMKGENMIVNVPVPLDIVGDEDVQLLYEQFGAVFQNDEGQREAAMLTSRGCFWNCSFCSTPNSMGRTRYRNMKRVIRDLTHLYYDSRVDIVHFYDDVFITGPDRMKQFVYEMRTANLEERLTFKALTRADVLSRFPLPLLLDLRKCGLYRVAIGIESGDDDILHRIKCGTTTEMVVEALRHAKNADMKTKGFFMYGLPGETIEGMTRTYEFAKRLRDCALLDDGVAHFAKAYPGTDWETEAIRQGRHLGLSSDYIQIVASDGSPIRRNPAIPKISLCDVNLHEIIEFIEKTNRLWQ